MAIAPLLAAGLPLAAPLEFSLRSARGACVLDPRLALHQPTTALLAQQLGRVCDLWVPPAFWRLLDGSDFFLRRPASLCRWLGFDGEDAAVAEQVALALAMWSDRRASRDPSQIGLRWVGAEAMEGLHGEHAPRDLAQRFEALASAWHPPGAAEPGAGADLDTASMPHAGMEIAGECAALAVALDGCPVLALGGAAGQPPALAMAWQQRGLRCHAWAARRADTAPLAQWHWWQTVLQAGGLATASLCPPMALLRPVLPAAQWDGPPQPASVGDLLDALVPQDWASAAGFDPGEAWQDDAVAMVAVMAREAPTADPWARGECLWLDL